MKPVRRIKMPLKATVCVVSCLLLIALVSGPALSEESEHGHPEGVHENTNDVALFLGNTQHHDENGFSVGLDYEHRLNPIAGVGGLVEYSAGDFDSWIIAASLFVHPYKGFRLILAPGFENKDCCTNFLFRTGIAYQFEIDNKWSISPEYDIDFVHGEAAHVYGISFGIGF
jgi:hypothetical protein